MKLEEYKLLKLENKQSKYRNVRTAVGNEVYDSRREARDHQDLKLLEKAGEISDIKRQVSFDLEVNGELICRYKADFTYLEKGKLVVRDTKGVRTVVYIIKRKLMKAVWNIEILES